MIACLLPRCAHAFMTFRALLQHRWMPPAGLFGLALLILARTAVPTLYTFDSAELATAAWTLGLPHAPGYPLYLAAAHIFAQLPLGLDVAGRVNLFSALCLALAAVGVYHLLLRLYGKTWLALGAALVWVWSYYVWSAGIVAEVYAPQVMALAWTAWALSALPGGGWVATLRGGAFYGIALGLHPGSVLFAPAIAAAYLAAGVRLSRCAAAALVCALVFGAALLYFPLRYQAGVSFSLLGQYDAAGQFVPVDLTTPGGVLWVVRGAQFDHLFFNSGEVLPTRVARITGWLAANFLGLGVAVGLVGIWALRRRAPLLLVWGTAVIPFIIFYVGYGAPDVETMLVPLYLLWMIVFAAGWQWFGAAAGRQAVYVLFVFAALLLVVNYPLVDGSRDDSVRRRAEIMMETLPADAAVFGGWFDIVPLEYLQIVEGARPDVRLYNLFLFEQATLRLFLAALAADDQSVVALGERQAVTRLPLPPARLETLSFAVSAAEIDVLRLEAYRVLAGR